MPNNATFVRDPVLVDLALRGGGSHGAFTWGVLDRLLEEPWLKIDGVSGTSAGAMNAAILVHGYQKCGVAGCRASTLPILQSRRGDRLRSPPSAAVWAVVTALAAAIAVLVVLNLNRLPTLRETMDAGANAAALPVLSVASLVGFGAVVAALPDWCVTGCSALKAALSSRLLWPPMCWRL